jgi:raffinose/stachyose/melibiose transport system substrate-binding protein
MVLAATAIATALIVTGCSSGSGPASNGPDANAKVTLTFATNQITAENTGISPVFKEVVSDFQKKHPNVKIQLEQSQATALQQVVQVAFANHKVPDVFNFWRPQPAFNMDKYIASGQLADLSEFTKQPSIKNEFPADAWDTATVNGKVWGVPLTDFSVPFIVNKSVFDQAGLPLPTTWAKLKSDVPALKAKGIIPWAVSTNPSPQSSDRLLDYILDRELGNQAALDLFKGKGSFTSAKVVKALDDYTSISNGMGPSDAAATDDNGIIAKYFNTGKAAMLLTNSGFSSAIDKDAAKNMTVLPFPTIPGGAQTSPHIEKDLTALMYASTAAMKDKNKASYVKELLTDFTDLSSQKKSADNGVLVAAKGVKVDPAKAGKLFADIQISTSQLPGDKWLGNARTPSQQQTFYPLMSQQWAGNDDGKAFAQQLQSMFN